MLNSVRLKKFYLVVAKRYETQVLEGIASLNAAQLIDAREFVAGEAGNIASYDRFLRAVQRCSTLLSTISALKRRFEVILPPPEGETTPDEIRPQSTRVTEEELERSLADYESRLDELNREVDRLLVDVEIMNTVKLRLAILQTSNVEANALGIRRFTVVKAGLVSNQVLSRLTKPLTDLGAVYEVSKAYGGESLVVILVPRRSEVQLNDLMSKYDFREFDLPPDLDPNPTIALARVTEDMRKRLGDSAGLEKSLREMASELGARVDYVNFLRDATAALSRTKDLSAIQGWIVESAVSDLREKVGAITTGTYYLQIENPRRGEQAPVLLKNRGWVLRGFELLTSIRGMPSYNEMDPTFIFALLFPLMYGMMFGDVGDGAVILVLGIVLYRTRRRFLGISAHALNSIGTIMVVGGLSGIVFGVLYGSFFLTQGLFRPLLFDPITAFTTIVGVALVFGVIQLAVSLVLNIRNHVVNGELREAVISGKGVLGLVYYILGVVLAAKLIQGGLQLSVFVSPANLPITSAALVCLLLIFLSPALRHLRTEGHKAGDDLIEGFGEFIEVFISFITNSLSYLRLAAFAIAHGIFASFALSLGGSIGLVASLVVVNAMVVVVEGFAVGIQSIRLLYYEFSTKFFGGTGQKFKPLTLKLGKGS